MDLVTTVTSFLATPLVWHGAWGGGGWGWGIGWLFGPVLSLFWLAVAAAVVWFIWRGRGWSGGTHDGTRQAREILAQRYAQGELTTEEYEDRLNHLR